MSKSNSKVIRPAFPRIQTTRSGSRYVRSIDMIRSQAGRKEIDLQLKNQPREKLSLPSDPNPPKSFHALQFVSLTLVGWVSVPALVEPYKIPCASGRKGTPSANGRSARIG